MPRATLTRPTAISQTFRITVANRAAMETAAQATGREYSAVINDALSRFFCADFPALAKAHGLQPHK